MILLDFRAHALRSPLFTKGGAANMRPIQAVNPSRFVQGRPDRHLLSGKQRPSSVIGK